MANEFAKLRRLRVFLIVLGLVAGVVALACRALSDRSFADSLTDSTGSCWRMLLGGTAFATSLLCPLMLAVLASRPVDIEHQGNGWFLSASTGLTPGGLCRVKFVTTGVIVAVATLAQSGLVGAIGGFVGITAPFPAGQWLGFTALLLVVNLVVLALHLLLAAWLSNQLICLGIGMLGVFFTAFCSGLPRWIVCLVPPWGYYAAIAPTDYHGHDPVWLELPYLNVLVLGFVGAAVFVSLTRLLSRREV